MPRLDHGRIRGERRGTHAGGTCKEAPNRHGVGRVIGALVDQYPEPKLELHPRLAEQHGIRNGDWVTITSRRAAITHQAMVVRTIRPDTVFIPYHWPGNRSANLLTHRTLDPRSKIPEYKVSACRIARAQAPADLAAWRRQETGGA